MSTSFKHWRWSVALVIQVVGLCVVLGSVGPAAWAQVVDDTSRAAPSAIEPAGVDSLPARPLAPPPDPVSAPTDTGEVQRAIVNADSLSTRQRGGERVQELFGNVFVQRDTTRLRSEYALRYLTRSDLLFVNDVVVYERGDTLRADTVRYNRATEVGRARGNVQLTNGDVVVRADSATYFADEKRSVFPDSVVLVDGDRVLRAQRGTYWSEEERAEFGGRVRLTEPGTTLLADSLTYYRGRDRSIALGNVFIDRGGDEDARADTTARTYLFGARADNREARRYSRVEGNALLLRVRTDSTGTPTDTLVVRARRLEAFRTDTHRRLVAVDSVRIWQPDLSAVADSAVYDRVVAATPKRAPGAPVAIDTSRPPPDSLIARADVSGDLAPGPASQDSLQKETPSQSPAGQNRGRRPRATSRRPSTGPRPVPGDSVAPDASPASSAQSSRRWRTPTARADSVLPVEETRLFGSPITWFEDSQVWGDSIRVRARNRSPDTVFVRGSGFAAQRDSVLDRVQQLKAKNLVAFFADGTLRRIRARPNARAIRFLATEADSLNGAARTSGDRIELRFQGGGVRRLSVVGGTQTTYYRTPQNIPDPFELEGFQWTPERRPRREGLLRDGRVRQHLNLAPPQPSRPVAGPPDLGANRPIVPDSTAPDSLLLPPRDRRRASLGPAVDSSSAGTAPPDSVRARSSPSVPADTSATKPLPDS